MLVKYCKHCRAWVCAVLLQEKCHICGKRFEGK